MKYKYKYKNMNINIKQNNKPRTESATSCTPTRP